MATAAQKLGKYERLDRIAQDGGVVLHRGVDPANGRAILLHSAPLSGFVGQDERLARFRREAGAAARLIHPNIVPFYASGETESVVFIATEPVSGNSLDRVIDQLTGWADRLTILRAVLDALSAAHRNDLAHGALSPAVIWLRVDGTIGVSGFGMAALHASQATQTDDLRAAEALTKWLLAIHREQPAVAALLARLDATPTGFSSVAALRDGVSELAPKTTSTRSPLAWRPLAALLVIGLAVLAGFVWQRKVAKIRTVPTMTASAPPAAPEVPAPLAVQPSPSDAPPPEPASPSAPSPEPPKEPSPTEAAPPQPAQSIAEPPADEKLDAVAPETPVAAPRPSATSLDMALRSIPCAVATVEEEAGRLVVSGTAAGEAARSAVQALLDLNAEGREVRLSVTTAPESLCAPLTLVAGALMANADQTAPMTMTPIPRPLRPDTPLHNGDPLILDITGPPYKALLQVDYYTTDGNVVHLLPNPADADSGLEAAGARRLGERIGSGRFWSVGPPFGHELVVAMASIAPLFSTPRPEIEPASAYLSALKQAIDAQPVAPPGAQPRAVALFITTQP
jgi:eukaryotic-like serine/threonine-protein kinase